MTNQVNNNYILVIMQCRPLVQFALNVHNAQHKRTLRS